MVYPQSTFAKRIYLLSINLDNLEQQQDRWAKQYESSKRPPPSPKLNSPRSLAACKHGKIDPFKELEKYSLVQHLLRLNNRLEFVEQTFSSLSEQIEVKPALQAAVRAFQHIAVGIGTSKEKLVAYMEFLRQEEARVPRLLELQQIRYRIIATEESGSPVSHDDLHGTVELPVMSGNELANVLPQTQDVDFRNELNIDTRSIRKESMQPDTLSNVSKSILNLTTNSSIPTSRVCVANLKTPLFSEIINTYETNGNHFCHSKVPYRPRNALALNTNYFSNRFFKDPEAVSNPSGVPLLSFPVQPKVVNGHLSSDNVMPGPSESSPFYNKKFSVSTLAWYADKLLHAKNMGLNPTSSESFKEGYRETTAIPYGELSYQLGMKSAFVKEETNTAFRNLNKEGSTSSLATDRLSSFSIPFSRESAKLPTAQDSNRARQIPDVICHSSLFSNSVKQSAINTFIDYEIPLEDCFICYCANPSPLFG